MEYLQKLHFFGKKLHFSVIFLQNEDEPQVIRKS